MSSYQSDDNPGWATGSAQGTTQDAIADTQMAWDSTSETPSTTMPTVAPPSNRSIPQAIGFRFIPLTSEISPSATVEEIKRLVVLRNPSACFLGIPEYVRDIVYGYILVNPALGRIDSVSQGDTYGEHAEYSLSPAILQVCRQTHTEGSRVLYHRNIFYIAFIPNMHKAISPITRYVRDSDLTPMISLSAVAMVRRWIVVTTARDIGKQPQRAPPSFMDFARAIVDKPPQTLELTVIEKGVELGLADDDYLPISALLHPARLFRGIEYFELRDATILEVPDCIRQDENAVQYFSHLEEDPVLEVKLTLLARGNDTQECCFKMYPRILNYARCFERNEFFRKEMGLREDETLDQDDLGGQYYFYHNNPLRNPFKGKHTHPVEGALMLARVESDVENIDAFKRQRAIALYHLEHQFQKVSKAALHLNYFVKGEKRGGGLFDVQQIGEAYGYSVEDVDEENFNSKCTSALLLLQQYGATFQRDLTADIQIEINKKQRLFDGHYIKSGIKPLLQDLCLMVEIGNVAAFVETFKEAVDSLDGEYIDMMKARQSLFEFDSEFFNDRRCSLDPQTSYCAEMVNWDVNEPCLNVEEGSDEDGYSSDEDNDSQHSSEDHSSSYGGHEHDESGNEALSDNDSEPEGGDTEDNENDEVRDSQHDEEQDEEDEVRQQAINPAQIASKLSTTPWWRPTQKLLTTRNEQRRLLSLT